MEIENTEDWIWWEQNVPILVFVPLETRFFVVYHFKRHPIDEEVPAVGLDGKPLSQPFYKEEDKILVVHRGKMYEGKLEVMSTLDSKRRLNMVSILKVQQAGFKLINKMLYPRPEEEAEIVFSTVLQAPIPDLTLVRNLMTASVKRWLKKEYGVDLDLTFKVSTSL